MAWEREIDGEFAQAMQAIGKVKKQCLTKQGLLGNNSACNKVARQLRERLVKVSTLATSPPIQDEILVYKAKRLGTLAQGGIELLDILQALSLNESGRLPRGSSLGEAIRQLQKLLRQLEIEKEVDKECSNSFFFVLLTGDCRRQNTYV